MSQPFDYLEEDDEDEELPAPQPSSGWIAKMCTAGLLVALGIGEYNNQRLLETNASLLDLCQKQLKLRDIDKNFMAQQEAWLAEERRSCSKQIDQIADLKRSNRQLTESLTEILEAHGGTHPQGDRDGHPHPVKTP